jgi:hypothetical protein
MGASIPDRLHDEPVLVRLYAYWDSVRQGRRMPDRRDIDPVAMGPTLLPHTMLVDVIDGGARARYRLMGTAIVERFGSDPTGRYFDELLTGSYYDFVMTMVRDVCTHAAPVYSESIFRWDQEGYLLTRRLYLPLTFGADAVAMAIVGQVFHDRSAAQVDPVHVILTLADGKAIEQRHEFVPLSRG